MFFSNKRKLSSDAEVTVISDKAAYCRSEKPSTRQPLDVMGQFTGVLHSEKIFVVRDLQKQPTRSTIDHSSQHIDATREAAEPLQEQFPKVFTGLGTMGDEYTIKKVHYHTLSTLQEECPMHRGSLSRRNRVIGSHIEGEHTPWCAGMVVVPKKNGSVRICVDLKLSNESMLREVHPVDEQKL